MQRLVAGQISQRPGDGLIPLRVFDELLCPATDSRRSRHWRDQRDGFREPLIGRLVPADVQSAQEGVHVLFAFDARQPADHIPDPLFHEFPEDAVVPDILEHVVRAAEPAELPGRVHVQDRLRHPLLNRARLFRCLRAILRQLPQLLPDLS